MILENFEISKFSKMHSGNLLKSTLPNMWLLVLTIQLLHPKLNKQYCQAWNLTNRILVKLGTNEVDLKQLSWNIKQPIYHKIPNTKGFYYTSKKNKVFKQKKQPKYIQTPNVKGIYYRIFKLISVISKKIYYISLETKHDIHGFCFD